MFAQRIHVAYWFHLPFPSLPGWLEAQYPRIAVAMVGPITI